MKLNKEQKEAAEALEGPLLIVAGPGTGKTQLLSERAAHIMRTHSVTGDRILILTYTNAAAKSAKERLARIVGAEGYRVFADTFHGFANSVVLDSEEASAYIRERVQMTELEKRKALEYILDRFTNAVKELRPFGHPYLYVPEIIRRISDLKNEGVGPEDFARALKDLEIPDGIYVEKKHVPRLRELAFIYRTYEDLKNGHEKDIFDERGRYDYDDMILLATKVLTEKAALRNSYRERFRYIMVDEFQDTNGAQLHLLFSLCDEKGTNLCCVGDDDQSIYRFQGASVENFRVLRERFPRIKVIHLKNNYRSTKEIIRLAARIIRQIPARERLDAEKALIPKREYEDKKICFLTFSTEDEEIVYIIRKVHQITQALARSRELTPEERKKPYNQIAILVRKRSYILKLIDAFLRAGIPYATDGREDISRQKRVRQMIDVLTLARTTLCDAEEKDLTLYRVLSCDFLGIPPRDVIAFIHFVNREKDVSAHFFSEFIRLFRVDDLGKRPGHDDTRSLEVLKKIRLESAHALHVASWAIQRLLQDADARPVHDLLMGFVDDVHLYRYILAAYDAHKILLTRELRSLTSFINKVKHSSLSRPDVTLTEFLDELETMKTHNIPIEGQLVTTTQDGVRIITAHASKGQEFHTCFIPFCIQDKSWPLKALPERIPLPPSIVKKTTHLSEKAERSRLAFFDEARLFYVAASRAKSNLFFTSSPTEDAVTSSFMSTIGAGPETDDTPELATLKEFMAKGEGVDPLKGTEDVLADLVKNLMLTPTKLNNFIRCKRKFLYDNLLLLPGRKKQSLVFGNCAHKALEDTYRAYGQEGTFPGFTFFRESFEKELLFQGVNKTIENWCRAKLGDLTDWFERTRSSAVIPIDLEKKKVITLKGGILFSGKFDKIEFEDEKANLIRIVDYKTGKPDEHVRRFNNSAPLFSEECDDYVRQLVAYKLLYERDIHEPPAYTVSHGVLTFLEPVKRTSLKHSVKKGDYIDTKIPITDAMARELEEGIGRVWREINELAFDKLPERDRKKCGMCSFDSICWEG